MKKLLIMTAALLALQAIPALAEETSPKKAPEGPMFAEQDVNKDGTVSEEEFLNFGKKKFGEIDGNSDGQIDKEEAKKHHEARREKWKQKRKEMQEKRGDKVMERREKVEEKAKSE